jgi:hypothetical protein
MSTESIATSTRPVAGPTAQCALCGASLDSEQRYCLECGERRASRGSTLLDGSRGVDAPIQPPSTPKQPPSIPPTQPAGQHGSTTAAIAGVGVLLLAMGVGVLIGRSGSPKQPVQAVQTITQTTPASTGVSAGSGEPSFHADWPSGTSGYTVQLRALPQAGTAVAAVQAAKNAATSRGAKEVGALSSGEFRDLSAGSYVIYSGVFHKKADATRALAGLRRDFPGAKVLTLSTHSSSAAAGSSAGGSHAGSDVKHPAPPSVLEGLNGAKGKSYAEKSKNLPDVVSTG